MKQLAIDSIKKWAYTGSKKLSHPVSIATLCPTCALSVVFNTKRRHYDAHRDTLSCSADCPSCDTLVHFWVVDMVLHTADNTNESASLFLFPQAGEQVDFSQFSNHVPKVVLQYCESAQDIYFSGNLTACNVLSKSALEAIFFDLLPAGNSKTTLPKMIRDSMETFNLNQPLDNLRTALKTEGNLDLLFTEHQNTDQRSADAMMKLLEILIEYLYVLPARFEELENTFEEIDQAIQIGKRKESEESAMHELFDERGDSYGANVDTDKQGKAA